MRASIATAALAVVLGMTGAAWAQDTSSDQLIESLKPKTLGLTKGLKAPRPALPPSAVDQSAAAASPTPMAVSRQRAAAQAASMPVETMGEAPSASITVQFRTGSADLTPAAMRQLDQLGRALTSATLASYKFRIEGHTDTVGSKDANQALSERRAQTVVAYLESKFGVSADRLQAVGMGENGLAVATGDQVPEARNRRVQVVNLGA